MERAAECIARRVAGIVGDDGHRLCAVVGKVVCGTLEPKQPNVLERRLAQDGPKGVREMVRIAADDLRHPLERPIRGKIGLHCEDELAEAIRDLRADGIRRHAVTIVRHSQDRS
jgi:hypothetical protein